MEVGILETILKGVKSPSSNDVEQGITVICNKIQNQSLSSFEARSQLNSMLATLSANEKEKWLNLFNDLLNRIHENEDNARRHQAKIFRRFLMGLEGFSVLILLPLIIIYFIVKVDFPWWLEKGLYAICGLVYLFIFVKYVEYDGWKRDQNEQSSSN